MLVIAHFYVHEGNFLVNHQVIHQSIILCLLYIAYIHSSTFTLPLFVPECSGINIVSGSADEPINSTSIIYDEKREITSFLTAPDDKDYGYDEDNEQDKKTGSSKIIFQYLQETKVGELDKACRKNY